MNRSNHPKTYDWLVIQNYYDIGHTMLECSAKFGFNKSSWTKAVKRGDIIPRHILIATENLKSRTQIKERHLKSGDLEYKCAICENPGIHLGHPLPLELDHINGIKSDNKLENLRLLCPNCHAQQPTSNGKNKGKYTNTSSHYYKQYYS